jgi:hypothetical protein
MLSIYVIYKTNMSTAANWFRARRRAPSTSSSKTTRERFKKKTREDIRLISIYFYPLCIVRMPLPFFSIYLLIYLFLGPLYPYLFTSLIQSYLPLLPLYLSLALLVYVLSLASAKAMEGATWWCWWASLPIYEGHVWAMEDCSRELWVHSNQIGVS